MENKINGYELSRSWFDWAFENPELISPNHSAIYFFAVEHCNRLGWKEKFGFPTQMAMDAIGIKKHQTYIKYFDELVNWGFIKLIQRSKNQYSANIISLSNALLKNDKALDKALIKHRTKQTESMGQSTGQSNSSIDKQVNKETSKQVNNDGYSVFISELNRALNKNYRGDKKSKTSFEARIKEGFIIENFKTAILNSSRDQFHIENNYKFITPEFLTRQDKLDKFGQIEVKQKPSLSSFI